MQAHQGCSLEGEDAGERIAAWSELIGTSLREREMTDDGFALHFEPREGLDRELRRLAELERDCCATLSFEVRSSDDRVTMEVRGSWQETPWRMAMPAETPA